MAQFLDHTMTMRLELFVEDVTASIDFYRRVLGFEAGEQQPDQYTPMTHGKVTLSLNLRAGLPHDHPAQAIAAERVGRGIEIVLEVDHIHPMYQRVVNSGWPLSGQLQRQPWGLTDFRLSDPDGYYVRVTSRD